MSVSYPSASVKSQAAVLALITVNPRASLTDLMDATGLCRSSIKSAIRALISLGQLVRLEGGGGRGQISLYGIAEKGSERGQIKGSNHPDKGVNQSEERGQIEDGPRARGVVFEVEVQELRTSTSDATHPSVAPTSQTIVGAFVDEARAEGIFVSRQVIGQVAQNVKKLLDEGATPDQVVGGLRHMVQSRKVMPHLLGQFLMESQLPKKQKPARFGRGLSCAQILEGSRAASYLDVVSL